MKILTLFSLVVFLSLSINAQPTSQKIQELDTYIAKAVADWETPGLAIVVCNEDKVILSKGYGVREINKPDKVDAQTLFACASTTKAMTAVAMGMLVDEGKVRWTDKVIQYLPDFRVGDPYLTNEMTIRDLFTHNAGMSNADFLWSYSDWTSDEIMKQFALIKPAYSLRGGYTYQNIMYLIAGKVIAKVSGLSWADFVKKRIFTPLSMTRTFPTLKASLVEKNRARPHERINGVIAPIEDSSADVIDAAGSAWSCVEDMSKWMRFMLDSARIGDRALLSPQTYSELFKAQSIVTSTGFYPTAQLTKPNWTTYGLGWFQHDYKGKMVQFHTGSLDGTVALHGLIPSEKIGVYVFGNLDHTEVRHALMYRVFDLFLGEKERDWSAEFKKLYDGLREQDEKARREFENRRVFETKPSLILAQYTGIYTDPIYGTVEVTLNQGRLAMKVSSKLSLNLSHWHFDTFKGTYDKAWIPPTYMNFLLDANGKVGRLQWGNVVYNKKM